jgi:hypothetical protein
MVAKKERGLDVLNAIQHQNKEAAPLHLPCLFKPIRTPWWKKNAKAEELGRVMPFRLDCAPLTPFTRNLSARELMSQTSTLLM